MYKKIVWKVSYDSEEVFVFMLRLMCEEKIIIKRFDIHLLIGSQAVLEVYSAAKRKCFTQL